MNLTPEQIRKMQQVQNAPNSLLETLTTDDVIKMADTENNALANGVEIADAPQQPANGLPQMDSYIHTPSPTAPAPSYMQPTPQGFVPYNTLADILDPELAVGVTDIILSRSGSFMVTQLTKVRVKPTELSLSKAEKDTISRALVPVMRTIEVKGATPMDILLYTLLGIYGAKIGFLVADIYKGKEQGLYPNAVANETTSNQPKKKRGRPSKS